HRSEHAVGALAITRGAQMAAWAIAGAFIMCRSARPGVDSVEPRGVLGLDNITVLKLSNSHFMLLRDCGPKPPGDRKRALAVRQANMQPQGESLLQICCRWRGDQSATQPFVVAGGNPDAAT